MSTCTDGVGRVGRRVVEAVALVVTTSPEMRRDLKEVDERLGLTRAVAQACVGSDPQRTGDRGAGPGARRCAAPGGPVNPAPTPP
jgi:hypothetical protein